MTVSFDFDDTYTANPEAMAACIDVLLAQGHTVIVTTGRGDHHRPLAEDVIRERFGDAVPVIRANLNPRGKYAEALARGYNVDVWVDDEPWGIKPDDAKKRERKEAQRRRTVVGKMGLADFNEYMEHLGRK